MVCPIPLKRLSKGIVFVFASKLCILFVSFCFEWGENKVTWTTISKIRFQFMRYIYTKVHNWYEFKNTILRPSTFLFFFAFTGKFYVSRALSKMIDSRTWAFSIPIFFFNFKLLVTILSIHHFTLEVLSINTTKYYFSSIFVFPIWYIDLKSCWGGT